MKTRIVLHPGFPKTATNTLQREVFKKLSNINYLGVPYRSDEVKNFFWELKFTPEVTYDPTKTKKFFDRSVKPKLDPNKVNLISDERLLKFYDTVDAGLIANRLQAILKDVDLLFTIRNQLEWLTSYYSQWVKKAPFKHKFETFDEWFHYSDLRYERDYTSLLEYLQYDRYIHHYQGLYPNAELKVILFEELREDPENFSNKLSDFLKSDRNEIATLINNSEKRNERISKGWFLYKRLRKRLTPLKFLKKLSPSKIKNKLINLFRSSGKLEIDLSKAKKNKIKNLAGESNRRLAEEFDLPLEDYNYPMK